MNTIQTAPAPAAVLVRALTGLSISELGRAIRRGEIQLPAACPAPPGGGEDAET